MILKPGATLGRYAIDELLGRGGFGEVYRAHDTRHERHVALKVLSPEVATPGPQFARFQREARTGALLNHPNVVTVYEVACERGVPFVASELLRGATLRARLAQGPLTATTAVRYARQIAAGLAAAHEMGVAHRDLKPENIFVTADDCVKVLDFGLAKYWPEALELVESDSSDEAASALGEIGYLAPEQVRGEEADDRSDIFSLGVILYEMLSGAVPFRRHSTIDTLQAILHDDVPRLAADDGLARELDRVIRRCLEKDTADRFRSARDLEFNLEIAEAGPRRVQETRAPMTFPPPARKRRLLETVMRLL